MSRVLSWALQQLTEIRVAISTGGISKENLLTISAVVKVRASAYYMYISCFDSTPTGENHDNQLIKNDS